MSATYYCSLFCFLSLLISLEVTRGFSVFHPSRTLSGQWSVWHWESKHFNSFHWPEWAELKESNCTGWEGHYKRNLKDKTAERLKSLTDPFYCCWTLSLSFSLFYSLSLSNFNSLFLSFTFDLFRIQILEPKCIMQELCLLSCFHSSLTSNDHKVYVICGYYWGSLASSIVFDIGLFKSGISFE